MRAVPTAIILFFLSISSGALGGGLFEPQVPDEISVYTVGRDTKKFWNLLASANDDSSLTIRDTYKNKLNANVRFENALGQDTFSTAKIRLTGDWKDHLSLEQGIASLSVELKTENIGNIVKFRLLLPKTRNFSREVFWSILMEELGYPVPFRKMVTVNFNGYMSYPAIFEEAAEKEFLERYGYRESPIIEVDERQHWANVSWRTDVDHCLGRNDTDNECDIDDWPEFESYKVDNAAFVKNPISASIALKALNIENVHGGAYDIVNSLYASHGLDEHNRKRIYDPMYGVHIPVYFDGDVDIFDCDLDPDIELSTAERIALDRIEWKFRSRVPEALAPNMRCAAIDVLKRAGRLSTPDTVHFHAPSFRDFYAFRPLRPYPDVRPEVVGYSYNEGRMESCRVEPSDEPRLVDCRKLEFEEARKYLIGSGEPYRSGVYSVFPAVVGDLYKESASDPNEVITSIDSSVDYLVIEQNQTVFLKLSTAHGRLDAVFEDATTSRLVIYGSNLGPDFALHAVLPTSRGAEQTEEEENARYDERLLTSCVTFMDIKFSGSSIYVSGGGCEDSLNFIRSNGFLSQVSVKNAASDAMDADFSHLDILELEVQNALNDCLDLSAGFYNLATVNLAGCGDKAISAGERSRVAAGAVAISAASIGLASKDSSRLHVLDASIDGSSVPSCAEAYRKKQEFNGAELVVGKSDACSSSAEEDKSSIELQSSEVCTYFDQLNDMELCVTDAGLSMYVAHERPLNYTLNLSIGSNSYKRDFKSASLRRMMDQCDFSTPCSFVVPWSQTPDELWLEESQSHAVAMHKTYINLKRLRRAK